MKDYERVYAGIDLDAIEQNIRNTKQLLKPSTKLLVVIKADGYGHGAVPIAKTLDSLADMYGVAVIDEAVELREHGIEKPVLILGTVSETWYSTVVEYDIIPAVYTMKMAEGLSKAACEQKKTIRIHIKVDTGMGRIGMEPTPESALIVKQISELPGIEIDGCFTHMARADEQDKTYAWKQYDQFMYFIKELEKQGITIPVKHIANSASIMELPEFQLDMVRSGISTYGLYPSEEVDQSRLKLIPAMSFHSRISYVKEMKAGCPISYGGTYVTDRRMKVATIPVGYADGYPRGLSNQGYVLIRGMKAPILGRVCMDQFMVDVTGIPDVAIGDMATLVGKEGDVTITVEELAEMVGSFNYEFVCDISKRVPRLYHHQGKEFGFEEF